MAAVLLGFVKAAVLFRPDRVAAARRWVPVLFAPDDRRVRHVSGAQGPVSRVWSAAGLPGAADRDRGLRRAAALSPGSWVLQALARDMENRRKQVANLFKLPLIFAAALLSFAHGANDVANAVGPLAAIVHAAQPGDGDRGRAAGAAAVGAGHRRGRHLARPCAVRPAADPHRRREDHQDGPDPRLVRGAGGGRPRCWSPRRSACRCPRPISRSARCSASASCANT